MLRFCFGASGAGKSTTLYRETIERSLEDSTKKFFIIVPDQFTMQTQMDVVKMHPLGAIMNIDVLSFGRLSYRIFEETGLGSFSVLDDVGKSLVLFHVADLLGDKLPLIGKNMHKSGYIDEVKSTISEFMQYKIGDEQLSLLEEKSSKKGALNSKIKDLRLLYSEFLKYIEGNYITAEETLDVLCRAIDKSDLIKDSIVIFDGFTGFTPIQYHVIQKLLSIASEVMVSVIMGPDEDPYASAFEEQELFMLGKKTVRDLEFLEYLVEKEKNSSVGSLPDFNTFRHIRDERAAKDPKTGDIRITQKPVKRLENNRPMTFLEENLFRYNSKKYTEELSEIQIYTAKNPVEEVRQTLIKIKDIVRQEGYAYRDIAIVCGSLEGYGNLIERGAAKFDIPVFIDRNLGLMLNPFVEYITSAVNIIISGYKYEDVFHYMKSGMTDYSRDDTDLLENYVIALGINGARQWEDKFLRRMPRNFKDDGTELLNKLEGMRSSITGQLSELFEKKNGTVEEITDALIAVIEKNNSKEKLSAFSESFKARGDWKRAREYEQIYDKVMALLSQIKGLIGQEKITLDEYRDILKVGFGKIEVGSIPQDVDRIIVGDIERTRLKEIKVLFFLGVNDGAIPKNAASGGILSDIDRQYLLDVAPDVELSPTPRQQMYIQRLYLYMNLTKPTDRLYLSYSEIDQEGKSLRPAYLVPKLLMMFERLQIERPEMGSFESQNVCPKDSYDLLSDMLRNYAAGTLHFDRTKDFFTLYKVLKDNTEGNDTNLLDKISAAAFAHYESKPLAKEIALALYGATLENSVSRLEKFATCCYAHFLSYGLKLKEREKFEFDASDLGNVYHEVLEKYTGDIIAKRIDPRTIKKAESDAILRKALEACADQYKNTILHSSVRNQYMQERLFKILARTVDTLNYQLTKGRFNPAYVELSFKEAGDIGALNIALSKDEEDHIKERMKLVGKIDRVDLYEDEDHVYVKVVDYKSGNKDISIASLYYGLQLQLVMYMDVALMAEKEKHAKKEVVPAALLYYHVDDPLADGKEEMSNEDIEQQIREKLRTTGLVNGDRDVVELLHEGITEKSDVIPVKLKKDGGFAKGSSVFSGEDYKDITRFVGNKAREFGQRILAGDISINPYEWGQRSSCTYCSFKSVCGYDERIPGYNKRKLGMKDEDALLCIKNEVSGEQNGD